MIETSTSDILNAIQAKRDFFKSQKSQDVRFRIRQLRALKRAILEHQKEIEEALWKDLHKSPEESYLTEINIVLTEIDFHVNRLRSWAKPTEVESPLVVWPSRSKVEFIPLGVVLIIAPWNYPFQLMINPLVGAISAGCCAIIKPSESAPHVAAVIEKIISRTFETNYVSTILGGIPTTEALLEQKFDLIFFTGSSSTGKIVMSAAAKHLTPVVLELGGKSPCVVDKSANIDVAAKRIAWGKSINAGQACVSPDYVLAHQSIKDELLQKITDHFTEMYGKDIKSSRFYPRIVNAKEFGRLKNMMDSGDIYSGGEVDESELYIAPTMMHNVDEKDKLMQEEIFGPILPVIAFKNLDEAINLIQSKEKPLNLYVFGNRSVSKQVLSQVPSGGACINDTVLNFVNHHLPFGGIGHSGMGQYHGKSSFMAFSHKRGIVSSPGWLSLSLKNNPLKHFKILKFLFR